MQLSALQLTEHEILRRWVPEAGFWHSATFKVVKKTSVLYSRHTKFSLLDGD